MKSPLTKKYHLLLFLAEDHRDSAVLRAEGLYGAVSGLRAEGLITKSGRQYRLSRNGENFPLVKDFIRSGLTLNNYAANMARVQSSSAKNQTKMVPKSTTWPYTRPAPKEPKKPQINPELEQKRDKAKAEKMMAAIVRKRKTTPNQ